MNSIINDLNNNPSSPCVIAGPCSVENYEMIDAIVKHLSHKGIRLIRGNIFKPRTSPYDFQGLGLQGLRILKKIKKKYHVKIVSEIVDLKYLKDMLESVDILQVGSRNMFNYELLKELGKTDSPILLKRGLCATIDEFINAAEYIRQNGNQNIIMCERGIRSYDSKTRNLLDLSCVALLRQETDYPVIADISHSLGRKDIAAPMSKAALAAGAHGIMVEVHNDPQIAMSDAGQQMDFRDFDLFIENLKK